MRKWTVFIMALLTLATVVGLAVTDPGEISAAPRSHVVVTPSYLDQLKAEAARTGKVVVWTGAGHDLGGSAILFDSVPVLMDKEDVGKPLADIEDENVRRTLEAVKMRLNHELPDEAAVREFTRAALSRFASAMEQTLAGGKALFHATEDRLLNLDEQATLINTALRARNVSQAMTEGLQIDPPMYEPGGCGYGDVCEGCYTKYYRQCTSDSRCLTLCGFACIDCRIP
jgi:hypothetical protein